MRSGASVMGLLSGEYDNQLGCWLTAEDRVSIRAITEDGKPDD